MIGILSTCYKSILDHRGWDSNKTHNLGRQGPQWFIWGGLVKYRDIMLEVHTGPQGVGFK